MSHFISIEEEGVVEKRDQFFIFKKEGVKVFLKMAVGIQGVHTQICIDKKSSSKGAQECWQF